MSRLDIPDVVENLKFSSTRFLILISCLFVMFFDGYDFTLLGYIAPALMRHFEVSKAAFGWTISASVFGYMAGAFLLGQFGDRFGRKPSILIGVALFSALTIACTFAGSIRSFAVMRFLAGVGLGGAVPNAVALVTEYTPKIKATAMIGVLFLGYTLGGAAPGWAANLLMPTFDWRSVALIGGVVPLGLVVVMFFSLTESLKFLATQPTRRSELFRIIKRVSPHVAISPESRVSITDEPERSVRLRLLFARGMAPKTVLLWMAFICCLGGNFFVVSWTATFALSLGFPTNRAAMVSAMFLTGAAIGCLVVPRVVGKVGLLGLTAALALAAPCIAAIGWIGSVDPAALIFIVLIGGVLAGGSQVALNATAGTIYPTAIRATGVGWALGIGRTGAIIAPIIGGKLISIGTPIPHLFLVAGVCMGIASVAIALLQSAWIGRPRVSTLAY